MPRSRRRAMLTMRKRTFLFRVQTFPPPTEHPRRPKETALTHSGCTAGGGALSPGTRGGRGDCNRGGFKGTGFKGTRV